VSAPLIWILFPFGVAVGLWFLQWRPRLVARLAAAVSLALALLAWATPIAGLLKVGGLDVEISAELVILGRRLVLDSSNQAVLVLLFTFAFFWFLGAELARVHRYVVPLALAMLSLLVATMAVEPFLYAALLVEVTVLLSIPMLVAPGQPLGQGVLRYLIFQTMALPFILLSGWALGEAALNPADTMLLTRAALLLGFGFAFWLAVFPFYTWLPLLAGQSHPYTVGFVLILLPVSILFVGLDFLNGFVPLLNNPVLPQVLRLTGVLMVATGGIWAAFQQNVGRLFGYAVIVESGFALLALSFGRQVGVQLFALSLLPRLATLSAWALAAALLVDRSGDLEFESLQGQLYRTPFICGVLLAAYFSIGGLPLLANFPVRLAVLEGLAQESLSMATWALVGSACFLASGFRLLAILVRNEAGRWQIGETAVQAVLLSGCAALLVWIGVFPNLALPGLLNLVQAFQRLQ